MTACFRLFIAGALLAFALPAFAADPAKGHDDGHAAVKGVKYEVVGHDDKGKVFVETINMDDPGAAARLTDLIHHGHAHEVVNKTAPTLKSMASVAADLGLWTLIIFGLLLFVLWKTAWPKMIAGLQKREENIRSALDEAEKARNEAQSIRVALQKDMDEAHLKVKALIDEGKRDAELTAKGIREQAQAEAAADRERMLREVQSATDQALQTIWSRAAELATEASSKALRRSVDGEGHRRLIDEALAELKQSASNA